MNWTTELLEYYLKNRGGTKEFDRDNAISHLLDSEIKCPTSRPYTHSHAGSISYRSPNILFDRTKEEQIEFDLIRNNPEAIISIINSKLKINYHDILIPYNYQKDIIREISENTHTLFNVSRQIGMTTCASLQVLHYLLNNKDKTVLFITNNMDSVRHVMDKLTDMYCCLPYHMMVGATPNKQGFGISFENGSSIEIDTHFSLPRTEPVNYLILQDYDHLSNGPGILFNLYEKSDKILIYSTPSSGSNLWIPEEYRFNNLYFDKTNKFKKYTYPNSITRKRNQKELIDMLGIESYITEYECLFPRTKEYDESLKLYSHAVI